MTNLFRNISKGLKKMIFGPFVRGRTLKREPLNACGFQQNEADTTPILNSENHKMLITIFRDISQKVSFSAILGTFWLVASEAEGFLACHIRLNVVHTRLNILTRNKKHLI